MADDVNVTVASCVMRVSNLDRSTQFYCDIFSCRVAVRSDDIALLLTPKGFQIYLHLREAATPRGIGALGVQHLVWSTDSRSDLQRITERIAAYDPSTYLHVDDTTGLTFVDACGPDSERVIVTYPGPAQLPRTAIAERLRD